MQDHGNAVVYRCKQVICRGCTDGARRVTVAARVLPYIPPPCERDPIGALTHEDPYRPTELDKIEKFYVEVRVGRVGQRDSLYYRV